MKKKSKPLWDRWTKYFYIGTTWGKAGMGNRKEGLIGEPGRSISLLRYFQGLQVCEELYTSLTTGGDQSELNIYLDV